MGHQQPTFPRGCTSKAFSGATVPSSLLSPSVLSLLATVSEHGLHTRHLLLLAGGTESLEDRGKAQNEQHPGEQIQPVCFAVTHLITGKINQIGS